MNVVASLCHRFPEAALVARRFLDKSSKRAAETKPRKGHAFDPTKLMKKGPFAGFPFYDTWSLGRTHAQANLLADFCGWVAKENQEQMWVTK